MLRIFFYNWLQRSPCNTEITGSILPSPETVKVCRDLHPQLLNATDSRVKSMHNESMTYRKLYRTSITVGKISELHMIQSASTRTRYKANHQMILPVSRGIRSPLKVVRGSIN